jgi:hypothetical protein
MVATVLPWSVTSSPSIPGGAGILLFVTMSKLALAPIHLPIQWVPGVKQLGLEADHSPPSSAIVENVWSYISTPSYVFMVWCVIKHRIHLHVVLLS